MSHPKALSPFQAVGLSSYHRRFRMTNRTSTTRDDLRSRRIGIFLGGDSPEREGSLISGRAAASAAADMGHAVELIDPSKDSLTDVRERIDIALLALHGPGGEDGKIQGLLEGFGIPYTGSGVLASALAMHKPTFKQFIAGAGLDTPAYTPVRPGHPAPDEAHRIIGEMGAPVILKPASGGGSLATRIVYTEDELTERLGQNSAESYREFFTEEFVPGKPVTVGLLDVDGELMALPPLEAETDREFYDYVAKHDPDHRRYYCPARLTADSIAGVQQLGARVHHIIGAHGFSRVDFIASDDGRISVLEANTLPGLSPMGNLATMAKTAGISYPELITSILGTALNKPRYLP